MQPKIFPADEHEIRHQHIDSDALIVLEKLREAGHTAYLVGGGVRDLLAKKQPKDFDISTSASPEDIRRLFPRQCLLIGRRFRLAHVRFGNKIIEVSTFRSGESGDELIVRDNQWGTPEEDACRRDFTINGLFLDAYHHQVIDYVGGWEDIHRGILRTIGDPVIRFKQDPVRMMRLLKFRARFGFEIDPTTYQALLDCRCEILKSSPARVLEELLRMLESPASQSFFEQMAKTGLLEFLLPWLSHFLENEEGEQVYRLLRQGQVLAEKEKKPLDRTVMSACLLYPILEREMGIQFTKKGLTPHLGDVSVLTNALIRGVATHSFPPFTKRIKYAWNFILTAQYRFPTLAKKVQMRGRMIHNEDFPYALSFLRLRASLDPSLEPLLEEWVELSRHRPEGVPHAGEQEVRKRHRRTPRHLHRPHG